MTSKKIIEFGGGEPASPPPLPGRKALVDFRKKIEFQMLEARRIRRCLAGGKFADDYPRIRLEEAVLKRVLRLFDHAMRLESEDAKRRSDPGKPEAIGRAVARSMRRIVSLDRITPKL
jgi:hypothetical protein